MPNYAIITDQTKTKVTVNAGHVVINMSCDNSNYMDILETLAQLMCDTPPMQLLEKLKSL